MSNELHSLIKRVEVIDQDLAKGLRKQFDVLSNRLEYGLNFERHTPESVALVGLPISIGAKVQFIPERGKNTVESDSTWVVTKITGKKGAKVAELFDPKTREETSRPVEDLVFVADFRDPIYPGLVSTGKVERGGDKPYHTVINAENYHALEALLYAHEGQVDAIYIDPPYNTGARDWKYNNDYVDGEDDYRHSKWLAFMERRLKIAKRLLNPRDSVLIATIDEKEYLRLGLLLEQTFPEATIQMVSIEINPKGTARRAQFARSDEYAYFVAFGDAAPKPQNLGPEWFGGKTTTTTKLRWVSLVRSGTNAERSDRPGLFYPILIDAKDGTFVSVGDSLPAHEDRGAFVAPEGTTAVWPIREDGTEGNWQVGPTAARKLRDAGYLRVGTFKNGSAAISYLKSGEQAKVRAGIFGSVTRSPRGHIEVASEAPVTARVPTTQWALRSHSASEHGSRLLRNLLPGRSFPFPKSLYAVEDALRFFVSEKPDALIIDFFSGSGTTAHAVMRLNKQDGGRRRSISVTNNEVGADEQQALRKRGLRPGDKEWESLGICDYITKPRIAAAVTGMTPAGDPVKGDYKFTDEFPMADGFQENVEFLTLTYENPALIEADLAFGRIAPLLWLRAGARGRRIDHRNETFDVADAYAVLFDIDASRAFLTALDKAENIRLAYIVTDDETQYQAVAGQLPEGVESVRLYESYLQTFTLNMGRQ